jgi:hypothetical protein
VSHTNIMARPPPCRYSFELVSRMGWRQKASGAPRCGVQCPRLVNFRLVCPWLAPLRRAVPKTATSEIPDREAAHRCSFNLCSE